MCPIVRFRYEWHDIGSSSTEQDGIDRDALRIFPFFSYSWTLSCRCSEASIRVRGGSAGVGMPRTPKPVGEVGRLVLRHSLPPDVALRCNRAIGEDRILRNGEHGVGVRSHARTWCYAEKARLRIDRI